MDALTLSEGTLERCRALGLDFMVRILEVEVARRPENLEALSELGNYYTRIGRYEEGLAADRRLVRLRPTDPTARYNLACSLALTGAPDAALEELAAAIELGYDDAQLMRTDEDLLALREHPRFVELLARLEDT